jgi:hypothetical protein
VTDANVASRWNNVGSGVGGKRGVGLEAASCGRRNVKYQSLGLKYTHLFTLYPTRGAFNRNAIHCPERRKQSVKKACAIISGRTNCLSVQVNGEEGENILD